MGYVAEKMTELATEPEAKGAAVKAADWLMKHGGYERPAEKSVIDARQIHITIRPGVEVDQRRLTRDLLEVVEGEVIDEEG